MRQQTDSLHDSCCTLDLQDAKLSTAFRTAHISVPAWASQSVAYQLSFLCSRLAGHILAVLASVEIVVGLLIAATAMGWSETAQLICNTPTMILEGGMLLVLMMSHMASHQRMRARLQTLLQRRVAFRVAADSMAAPVLICSKITPLEVDSCLGAR